MRLLSEGLGRLLLILAVVPGVVATHTLAHPHPSPDPSPDSTHGVAPETVHVLWSGDRDEGLEGDTTGSTDALAAVTDIPFNEPPAAVEQWNRGDHGMFPATSHRTAHHPANVELADGQFITDAGAAIFATQPSTRARLSDGEAPLLVAADGEVLGTVDYRIQVPEDSSRTSWELIDHEIGQTRLLVDGTPESTRAGTHTPVLAYRGLDDVSGTDHVLTLAADIHVELEQTTEYTRRHCRTVANNTTCHRHEYHRTTTKTETLTVSDSIDVVEHDLSIVGARTRYPNGEFGLQFYTDGPWRGYTLPTGEVTGVWRFYTARDTEWDTLTTYRDEGTASRHSPLHPLQVNAYPTAPGATASPRATVTLLQADGSEIPPPALPEFVNLDVVSGPYTASYGIATRVQTTDHDSEQVTIHGLVRGVGVSLADAPVDTIPIRESNLTLTVLNATEETVTVQARLREVGTGKPINTVLRDGTVRINGQRVDTTGLGTATVTIPRPSGGVTARFAPGAWWHYGRGYTPASTTVAIDGTALRVVGVLYQLAVPVSLFLLGGYLIDRITGLGLWPPWRRL